mmetsp:Transcript_17373/g.20859  ORF Transcript_17373/g.20859 Transcript_17373/m.20859 type:complete len:532 (+) Transcript_17373:285-1880(+)|eukprot:CAMPEP_0197845024 /NCGR_PEP_ID=MMETSP1438-20131217/1981_1 /TAXON_ID=1461541 /ORGANISM="Pterosperma sp., Strain CCMP1384" /LENGTH=531 /DNA_ID=CAMNT_0043456095 /DNA_START=282 /DNA_END=1877 /DNA_ORIENTATION=-
MGTDTASDEKRKKQQLLAKRMHLLAQNLGTQSSSPWKTYLGVFLCLLLLFFEIQSGFLHKTYHSSNAESSDPSSLQVPTAQTETLAVSDVQTDTLASSRVQTLPTAVSASNEEQPSQEETQEEQDEEENTEEAEVSTPAVANTNQGQVAQSEDAKSDGGGAPTLVLASYAYLDDAHLSKRSQNNPMSHVSLFCKFLRSSLAYAEQPLHLIGWKSTTSFKDYTDKIREANKFAKELPPDTIIVLVDAFDVLVQDKIDAEHFAHVLRTEYPNGMVFAGEGKCYPLERRRYNNGQACKDYSKSPLGVLTNYLNGGSWAGFAKDVAEITDDFMRMNDKWDPAYFGSNYKKVKTLPVIKDGAGADQYGFALMAIYGANKRVFIDTKAELFVCDSGYVGTYRANWERMVWGREKKKYKDVLTKGYPAIIHYNAGKKKFFTHANAVLDETRIPVRDKYIGYSNLEGGRGKFQYRDICTLSYFEKQLEAGVENPGTHDPNPEALDAVLVGKAGTKKLRKVMLKATRDAEKDKLALKNEE